MGMLRQVLRQLGSLLRERTSQGELDREFAFHVDMEAASLVAQGMTPEEARRHALLTFGGVARYQEQMRDGWVRRLVTDFNADVRFALRGLRRTPAFTVTAVSTLAIGLGGAAAVLTAIDRVLLEPLPYADEDRIVRIFQQNSETNRWSLSVADFNGIESWQRSFTSAVAIRFGEMALSGRGNPSWVRSARATRGLFTTLGVDVARGRGYRDSDADPAAAPVVVITDELARRHFGEADAVGATIVLDRESYTVIGVLPEGITGLAGVRADVWPLLRLETPTRRGPFGLVVAARLRDGVTLEAAAADLAAVSERLFPIYAAGFSDRTARLTPFPLREILLGDASKSLRVLFGAVVLVLLIALANVTNLVLVRSSGRSRELALRVALGAGSQRLARLLITESLVLALCGGVLALVVAAGSLRVLQAIGPRMPRLETVGLDLKTAAMTLLLAAVCALLLAAYPVAFSRARSMASALRGSDRRSSADRRTRLFQDGLVVAEFALALPLLAGAALLLNSFMKLQRVDTGIDPRNVMTVRVSLPSTQYAEPLDRAQFWDAALRELHAVPGVLSAAIATSLPPDNFGDTNNFDLVDRPVPPGSAEPVSPWSSISPAYFDAVGASLLSGRMFDERDHGDAPRVLIVSRSWAERYFPGTSPVGRQLISGGCVECPRSTIVGVVEDIKYSGLAGSGEGVYQPYPQGPRSSVQVVVRAAGDPLALLADIRTRLHTVDPALPLDDAQLMTDRLASAITGPRHWTMLVGGFAAVAVLLAAIGVFGVMSFVVSQRQRDFAVRLALGAAPSSLVRLIVRRGLLLAAAGTAVGVMVALQGTRTLEHVLFDVTATDPRALATVAALLLTIALLACYLPGRRAAAVDPVRFMSGD